MGKRTKISGLEDGSVEAGLVLLALLAPPGMERTQAEIAFVCGGSIQNIQCYERRALQKIKAEFERRGIQDKFQDILNK